MLTLKEWSPSDIRNFAAQKPRAPRQNASCCCRTKNRKMRRRRRGRKKGFTGLGKSNPRSHVPGSITSACLQLSPGQLRPAAGLQARHVPATYKKKEKNTGQIKRPPEELSLPTNALTRCSFRIIQQATFSHQNLSSSHGRQLFLFSPYLINSLIVLSFSLGRLGSPQVQQT